MVMRFFILILLSCLCSEIWGMNTGNRDTINDGEVATSKRLLDDSVPASYIRQMDSYYANWHANRRDSIYYVDSSYILSQEVVSCSDTVYLARLDSIRSAIPLSYNGVVRNYIELYTARKRCQLATMLGACEYYFPIFEEALDAASLPLELKFLPIIESALNPVAQSRAGACGLWQFMYSTGKMYKLDINSFVDERRDPLLSTKAAVNYLGDLYKIYGDWMLVIAAYNCGPGNVNKAIRRAGGKKNYWDIYYFLPKETRGYVPCFIGAIYAFHYHKEHGIYPIEPRLPLLCDTIIVNEALHFDQIAKNLDLSVEELRDLNPQYKSDVVPAGFGKTYVLKMPYDHVSNFIDNQDTIFACNRSKYFNDSDRMADPSKRIKVQAHDLGSEGRARLVYTVKSGDVPGGIASKFNVSLPDLKYWNNLNKRMTIHPGQKLVIYVAEKKAAGYKSKAEYTGKESNVVNVPKVETIDGKFVLHTVRKGENLWSIAKKYPSVTNQDIMKWNGFSEKDCKDIRPGQKLKIKI